MAGAAGAKSGGVVVMRASEEAATERKKRVGRYFRTTPAVRERRRATRVLVAGSVVAVIAVALGLVGSFAAWAAALPLVLTAFVLALRGLEMRAKYQKRYDAAEPKPKDAELDEQLQRDLEDICQRAMRRLDLTPDEIQLHASRLGSVAELGGEDVSARPDGSPMVVYGPGSYKDAVMIGDGLWRFDEYEVMVVCPTDRHLALYTCVLNFLTGGLKDEATHEYHYVDVVAVRTRTMSDDGDTRYPDRTHRDEVHFARKLRRAFEIVVSSGDRAGVSVSILDEDHPDHEEKAQRVDIDGVVKVVRELLRDKKVGLPGPATHPPSLAR